MIGMIKTVRKHDSDNGDQEKSIGVMGNASNEVGTKLMEGSNEAGDMLPIEKTADVNVVPVVYKMDSMTDITSEYSLGGDQEIMTQVAESVGLVTNSDNGQYSVDSRNADKTFSIELVNSGNLAVVSQNTVESQSDDVTKNMGEDEYSGSDNSDGLNPEMNLLDTEKKTNSTGICATTHDNMNTCGNDGMEPVETEYLTNSMQTEVIIQEAHYSQTELIIQENIETQTKLTTKDDKEVQTISNRVMSTEVQTDLTSHDDKESQIIFNVLKSTEVQTEVKSVEDQWIQTENVSKVDSESQTELSNHNIMTVDRIEVVHGMHTFPMQTDQDELNEMTPFKPDVASIPSDEHNLSKSGDKDSNSEVESTFSSVSKSDEKIPVTVSAGLDMRVGKYKELTFPPVSSLPKKPSTLQVPQSERTPLPMDLCTKEIPEEDKKKCNKKRKSTASMISATPYDYYKPAKCRHLDDMQIMPAHQGDVTLSPTSNVHLSPTGFMSASTTIIERSSMSIMNATPVRDLSVKHSHIKYATSPVVPSKFSPPRSSRLEGFRKLSLQPQLAQSKMFTFRMKRKIEDTNFTPFSLPSELKSSSAV